MPKDKLDIGLYVLFGSIFVLLLMIALFMLFRINLKRKNKLLLEKEMMAVQFENTLLESELEIKEETFTYIGRELHDNIGQVLSLISINLSTLNAPAEEAKLRMVDDMLNKAMLDLRNLSHSLDADHIRKMGWLEAVEKLLQQLQGTGKYTTDVRLADNLPTLDDKRSIILFRMIQEAINNIIKHAAAKRVTFDAKQAGEQLVITISDDGKGFDKPAVAGGAGLSNLQSRARAIKGTLAIESEPGKGTTVTISVKPGSIEQRAD